jgi:hypothetical protein
MGEEGSISEGSSACSITLVKFSLNFTCFSWLGTKKDKTLLSRMAWTFTRQESDPGEEDIKAGDTDSWVPTDMLQLQTSVDETGKDSVVGVIRVLGDRVCEDVPYVSALGRSIDPESGRPNAPVYQDRRD